MTVAVAIMAALSLGACGGGGDDGPAPAIGQASKPGLEGGDPFPSAPPWRAQVTVLSSSTWMQLPAIESSLGVTQPTTSQLLQILVPNSSFNHYIDFMFSGAGPDGYASTVKGSSIYSDPGFAPFTYVTTIDSFTVSNVQQGCIWGDEVIYFDVAMNITQVRQGIGFPYATVTSTPPVIQLSYQRSNIYC